MKKRLVWERLFAVLFALALWQIGSMALGQRLLLPSPVRVAERFCVLITEPGAWRTAAYSFFRIEAGFFLGLFTGCTLAALSAVFHPAEVLLWPFLTVIKAVPVASFIILALVWLNASGLSVFISFLMVLPVFYFNILEGIGNTDEKLLQAAEIFRMGRLKKLRYLYLPQIKPFFLPAAKTALGISWKAGIAAEVIGIPDGSIGERLYEAKLYLATADLFAWTAVIVILCILFEQLFLWSVKQLFRGSEGLWSKERSS